MCVSWCVLPSYRLAGLTFYVLTETAHNEEGWSDWEAANAQETLKASALEVVVYLECIEMTFDDFRRDFDGCGLIRKLRRRVQI